MSYDPVRGARGQINPAREKWGLITISDQAKCWRLRAVERCMIPCADFGMTASLSPGFQWRSDFGLRICHATLKDKNQTKPKSSANPKNDF